MRLFKEADKALESGSVEGLLERFPEQEAAVVRGLFQRALEKKRRSEESVEAGREFVRAYIEFMHYVERLQPGRHEY